MKVWRRHPVLTTGFVLAVVIMLAFAVRFAVQVVYWSTPAHQNQQLQGWMTPRYIARSWQVSAPELTALAALPPAGEGPRTLAKIATDEGVPLAEIIARVEAALALLAAEAATERATGDD
jgi:hypothetical protein